MQKPKRIFISYKRKDLDIVQPLINEIEKMTGEPCWYDLDGIETSAQFTHVICKAINGADVLLFMHSHTHDHIVFENDWTIRELDYARRKGKRIVLVKLDNAKLSDEFEFIFGLKNNIQINNQSQKEKLFRDLKSWLGEESADVEPHVKSDVQMNPAEIHSASNKSSDNIKPAIIFKRWLWLIVACIISIVAITAIILRSQKDPDPSPESSTIDGHEWIDLGLPSGLLWAACNLGATTPEEYGDYYAWGEIEPYYSSLNPLIWKDGKDAGYTWESYKFLLGNDERGPFSKYVADSSLGAIDDKTVLETVDDVAYVILNGKGRMPTENEWNELKYYCKWTWTSRHGVNGYLATGLNGNFIFLPAAGGLSGINLIKTGVEGNYWSSSLDKYSIFAPVFNFSDSVKVSTNISVWAYRCNGYSVRPVSNQ